MSKNRSSALKRDREARKNEKRAMKKQRREDRKSGDQSGEIPADGAPTETIEATDDPAAETTISPGLNHAPPQA